MSMQHAPLVFLSRGTGISQHIARSNKTRRTTTHDSIHERYQVLGTQVGYPLGELRRTRTFYTGSWDHEYAL